MNYTELAKRVAVSVFGIPLIFFLIYHGGIPFVILISIIQIGALWEFYQICNRKGFHPLRIIGTIAVLILTIGSYYLSTPFVCVYIPSVFILMMLIELFRGKEGPLANVATTLFGFLYIGLLTALVLLREMPERIGSSYQNGGVLIILIFVGIWICDTVAYFWGSYFGRHPLFKRVSPKKTWEGSIAGLVAALLSVYCFAKVFIPEMTFVDILAIGMITGVMSQLSDLVESLFKRDAKIKDSSNLLPGHGGMLDRFDSPILIGPIVYFYFFFFGFPA